MTAIVYVGPNLWAEKMANSPDADNRSSIRKRIEDARVQLDPKQPEAGPVSNLHAAWRMVIDLVAGTGFGVALGYGLDVLFGTLPIFLGVLTLLGFAAGVRLMIRTSREVQEEMMSRHDKSGE